MGFLDSVIVPKSSSSASPVSGGGGNGSFFSGITVPTAVESDKIAKLQSAQQVAAVNAANANSTSGLVKNTLAAAGSTLLNVPIDFAKSLWATYQSTPSKLVQDVQGGASDIATGESNLTKSVQGGGVGQFFEGLGNVGEGVVKAGARTAGDAAIAIFAPISSAIGAVLTATGGQSLIDDTGKVVANASGITDLPAFQKFAMAHPNAGDDFNRLLTLFMSNGEQGKIDPVKTAQDATDYARALVKDSKNTATGAKAAAEVGPIRNLAVEGDSTETPVEITKPMTRAERYQAYLNSQGYEPYTPESELPTIQAGKTPKAASDGLPVIQTEAPAEGAAKAPPGYTYAPVEPAVAASAGASAEAAPAVVPSVDGEPIAPPKPVSAAAAPKEATIPGDKGAKPVKVAGNLPAASEGDVLNSRAAKLEKAAIERKLVNSLGDLPTHSRIDMAEQADSALEYAVMHPEHALRVALGDSAPPDHILPEAIYTALETKAIREGDVDTIQKLAKSRIPTAAGQALKALDSVDPDSPVAIIRKLNDTLGEAFKKKTGKDPVKAVREEVDAQRTFIRKAASKRPSWEEFIKEVQCDY